jgi:CRP/FNR family cyclic AMP-dependent transcriptional regulator
VSSPTADRLAAIPLFATLSTKELREAAKLFTVRSYAKNAIVSTEGDRPEFFNFILSGSVQAFWRDDAGHQLKLGVDGPGDHFADVALGGEPVLSSHIAVENLRLASIRIGDMTLLLRRHPQMAVALLMDVVSRLRRLLRRTKTLTMQDVYGRVVNLLVARAAETGVKQIGERMTHADIGERIGATREMVGRVLRDLARGGYIRSERGRITVLRRPPARW